MKTRKMCLVVLSVCIWLALSAGTVSDVTAETIPESNAHALARKIHQNCKQYVFTVNAYTRFRTDYPTSGKKVSKDIKRYRNVGTAIPIDNQGHLITIHSVVKGAEKVRVITSTGKKVDARVLGSDHTGRISILKIDNHHISTLPEITPLNQIYSGKEVFFLGVVPGMSIAVNFGLIGTIRPSDGTIEVSTSGNPGTSGTPVFDKDENVLGLLAFQVDTDKEISPARSDKNSYLVIPLEYAFMLARHVINSTEAKCGWLGLRINLTASEKDGVHIRDVIKSSPADKSGIKPRDRIIEFKGTPISTPRQFGESFTNTKAGDKVSIKILRAGNLLSFDVILAERPISINNR